MNRRKYIIFFLVAISCLIMGIVDAVIQPKYLIKSIIKIILFLILPLIYTYYNKDAGLKRLFVPKTKGIKIALLSGVAVYIAIISAYFLLRGVFDFSEVVTRLNDDVGVNKVNFLWVAIYISFINSLLEEFFFRGFAFFTLKDVSSRKFAYFFSSILFALYHISMMIGWFRIELILVAVLGLFIGGIIFNLFNEKKGNIYMSWLIHIFANFAINTIGFILFSLG